MTSRGEAEPAIASRPDTPAPNHRPRPPSRSWFGAQGLIASYMGVAILVAMLVIFSLTLGSQFLSYENLTGIASSLSISGILAVGVMVPLAAGVFDVSIAGTMTLASTAVVDLFVKSNGNLPIPLAILIVLCGALIVGAVNGFLVVHEVLDSFITTIGMSSVLLGVSEYLSGGTTLSVLKPTQFLAIGRTQWGHLPITVVYAVVLWLLVWYVLSYTPLGRRIYATGSGREAARLSGVRTGRIIFGAFLVSACFAAAGGAIYAARLGSATPDVGSPYLLPAFSAAFLGSTIIHPGRFNVPGLVVAMLIVGIGINGLQLAGVNFWIVDLFQGAALLVAVALAKRGERAVVAARGKRSG